jgi:hypothetical protein
VSALRPCAKVSSAESTSEAISSSRAARRSSSIAIPVESAAKSRSQSRAVAASGIARILPWMR